MRTLDPQLIYPSARFFLTFIRERRLASTFFQHTFDALPALADARRACPDSATRAAVCDVLSCYNRELGASPAALQAIDALRDPAALCVVGGQQAGFLGGPLFVACKIASIVCTAHHLRERLGVPVVPIFWLATEDHDFDEINRVQWTDPAGQLQTIAFDWPDRGRSIERLPITSEVRRAYDDARRRLSFADPTLADVFAPASGDTYARWHARIWSRLFADSGLILVEPRVLRALSAPLFDRARTDAPRIHPLLADGAARLEADGYAPPLDPQRSGTLFVIDDSGARHRLDDAATDDDQPRVDMLSPDAALRPVLADALLPTVAQVLGPSELAYHAMLRPLYEHWSIPQPVPVPRHGGTVISADDAVLLSRLGVPPEALLGDRDVPRDALSARASEDLRATFRASESALEAALAPLREDLAALDPGLDARWRQTLDQCRHHLSRLEDRAVRADLARQGISAKRFLALRSLLWPNERPQERVVSAVSVIARHGVEWIGTLVACGEPDRFIHRLIVLEDPHEQG